MRVGKLRKGATLRREQIVARIAQRADRRFDQASAVAAGQRTLSKHADRVGGDRLVHESDTARGISVPTNALLHAGDRFNALRRKDLLVASRC